MSAGPTDRLAVVFSAGALVCFMVVVSTDLAVWAVFGPGVVLIVAAAVVDLFGASAHSSITVTRRHPPVVVLGSVARIEWDITSESRRAVRVMVAEPLAPSLQAEARRFSVTVPARSTVEASTRIRPMRRGRFVMEAMTVRVIGPLGLMSRQRDVPLRSVLRVHPPFRSAGDAELRIRRAHMLDAGTRRIATHGGGTDFEQLREYEVDDEYRRIDWTATARVGRAVVRTYRAERNQQVMVLLDSGRVQAGLVDGAPRVEYSMDATMMLATVSTRLGDQCGLIGFDGRVRAVVPPGRARGQVARIAEAMFDIEPELAESDYAGAFAFAVERFGRRTMMVLLTDLVDHVVSEALVPALPTLLRKHVVVVAAVRDPRLERWATGSGSDPTVGGDAEDPADPAERMAVRLAAVETLENRRLAVARLRSMGVVVVDAAPDRLASELGDAYLSIKGTGRL